MMCNDETRMTNVQKQALASNLRREGLPLVIRHSNFVIRVAGVHA